MFGIGPIELLVLLFFAITVIGVSVFIMLLARHGSERVAKLEQEVRRLREELDRQRAGR